MLTRRTLVSLMALAATARMPAFAQDQARLKLGPAHAFSREDLLATVKARAVAAYRAPPQVPADWKALNYDQYRNIIFKHTAALWRGTSSPFEVETFAPGLYFPEPVEISVIEDGMVRPLHFDRNVFTKTDQVPDLSDATGDEALGYSGFRLNALMNDPTNKSEFCVFQGASYFRAIGRGQAYGLSARGLALNTGDPDGEEFPAFRSFFIEKPDPGSDRVVVHAVLDSPSVAGLYTFDIQPGSPTAMNIEAVLFPRVDLTHVGIAPQTSMFLFDRTNQQRFDDFRAAVHDSDGLLIANGAGEHLWRPLANPSKLQVSSFVDMNPRGFGLMQRPRALSDYGDLQAHYHRRPGLWVTPGDGWGKGAVTLVEIPAEKEIYDNIVAYWRPREPLAAGQAHTMRYRLDWCDEAPIAFDGAMVIDTAMGARVFEEGRVVAVEFNGGPAMETDPEAFTIHTSANRGKVSGGILQRNPATGGLRLAFTFDPGTATSMELRAQLNLDGKPVSEVFLYRWTAA
jgi:glucans biosynthesis protein